MPRPTDLDLASALEPGSPRCPYDGEVCNIARCRVNRGVRCSPGRRVLEAAARVAAARQEAGT